MAALFAQVYNIVRQIPYGKVTTYGHIARLLDNPRLSRAVGYALHACTDSAIPCHRVVNRFGGLSPAFGLDGKQSHRFLLEQEGICFTEEGHVDLKKHMWLGTVIL